MLWLVSLTMEMNIRAETSKSLDTEKQVMVSVHVSISPRDIQRFFLFLHENVSGTE